MADVGTVFGQQQQQQQQPDPATAGVKRLVIPAASRALYRRRRPTKVIAGRSDFVCSSRFRELAK